MKIHHMPQRSPEWHAIRIGKVTASEVVRVLAKIKTGEAATRAGYRVEKAVEQVTGLSQSDQSIGEKPWVQHGTATEGEALAAYEASTGSLVERIGFVEHDTLAAGCSPDGFVDTDGMVEVKCPMTKTHLGYWADGFRVPPAYVPQITMALWLTGRQWCDFVSYDPRLTAPLDRLRLFVVRHQRDEKAMMDMDRDVRAFLAEVNTYRAALLTLAEGIEVLA